MKPLLLALLLFAIAGSIDYPAQEVSAKLFAAPEIPAQASRFVRGGPSKAPAAAPTSAAGHAGTHVDVPSNRADTGRELMSDGAGPNPAAAPRFKLLKPSSQPASMGECERATGVRPRWTVSKQGGNRALDSRVWYYRACGL